MFVSFPFCISLARAVLVLEQMAVGGRVTGDILSGMDTHSIILVS